MKILLILFGCLAVANAGYYYGYHFSSRCYYPPTRCFYFRISSCNAWYTTKYYSSILKVYPDTTCEEKDVATLKSECEEKLKTKREEIRGELDKGLEKYKTYLADIIKRFKEEHKCYQEARYKYCIDQATEKGDTDEVARLEAERDQKIKDYDDKLDQKKLDAEKKYQDSIDETMNKIKDYHDELIANFEKCLTERLTKIDDFNKEIDARVSEYEENYRKALEDRVAKAQEAFKKILQKINPDAADAQIDPIVALYGPETPVDEQVAEYRKKLDEYAQKLKDYYKCAYRCYAYSGCISFYKRGYYSYCRKLGGWWKYCIRYSSPCSRFVKYTYKWVKPEYKGLKTCNPLDEHITSEKLLEDMREKNQKAVSDAKACVETWYSTWEKNHAEYVKRYEEIIRDRHSAYIKYYSDCLARLRENCILTEEDREKIAEKTKELEDKVEPLVKEYEEKLKKKRDDAKQAALDRIDEWAKCLEEYVVKISENYQTCLDSFETKKKAYEEKLQLMIDARRKCLEDNYNRVIEKNVKCTEDIIKAWIGDKETATGDVKAFIDAYRKKLENERDTVLGEFDAHWATLKTDLATHYACQLKCSTPTYCVRSWVRPKCFSWRICYPVSRCYRYHYKIYYRYYYHKTIGGHYFC